MDFWFLGFASCVFWMSIFVLHGVSVHFAFADQVLHALETLLPTILILTSYPHLLISYKWGYAQGSDFTLKNWPYLIAAPLTIISIFVLAAMTWTTKIGASTLGYAALSVVFNIFLLGSGWHAMRQVFGVVMIYSGFKGFKFSSFQRNLLIINLYCVFLIDFVNLNLFGVKHSLFGLQFAPLGFSSYFLYITFALTGLSGLLLIYSLVTNSQNTNSKIPPKEALAAILALYMWALPCFFLPEFTIFAPNIFHSIQYFTVLHNAERPKMLVPPKLFWLRKWALWAVAGVFLIKFAPNQLDKWFRVTDENSFGFFSFCFFTFANLQHYFIDSCIWKSQSGSKLLIIVQDPRKALPTPLRAEESDTRSPIAS